MGMVVRGVALWLFSTGVCAIAMPASAQTCAEGRVASEASAGRCCWPGQTWSEADARCDGVPICPEGFGGDGNTCLALSASARPPQASAAGLLTSPREPVVPVTSTTRSVNNQLVFNGLALAIATYGGSLAAALLWSGSIAYFLPYGALVGAVQSAFYDGFTAAMGFAFGLGQVVATILIVAGSSFWRRHAAVELTGNGLSIAF